VVVAVGVGVGVWGKAVGSGFGFEGERACCRVDSSSRGRSRRSLKTRYLEMMSQKTKAEVTMVRKSKISKIVGSKLKKSTM